MSFKGSIARHLFFFFFPEGNHCTPKSTRLIKIVSPFTLQKGKGNLLLEIALHPPGLILKLTGHIVETSALCCEIFIKGTTSWPLVDVCLKGTLTFALKLLLMSYLRPKSQRFDVGLVRTSHP